MVSIDGKTRLYYIIGDPIDQVKSPTGMSSAFQRSGINAVMLPAHVAADHVASFLEAANQTKNCDGIVVTVPHKFACFEHCPTVSDRAGHLNAVNIMRRNENCQWHGDMVDGLGFVHAASDRCAQLAGKKALLVGAGGAGSAIALALLEAGVDSLAVHDLDEARRDALIDKLRKVRGDVHSGSSSPRGYELIVNATPAGMEGHDYLPVEVSELDSAMFVGCVVTESETPLIAAAKSRGCGIATGIDMYRALESIMLTFFQGGAKR
ncbi:MULTISPECIES: shikimate dehydrogenase family protein [Rhizobium]|uniref:Shikimate dehydrogenase n=1 Tax=Rhizobium aouanii TaxID=3118145 RepID=A0ABU8CJ74_9HYPH|nr:shikimate dehydrogenase [Rhizobium acaciae]MCW1410812.1 shikimate dehydrogenase [Rhizobium acaciae]MCW1742889.1 shikimate dehydrogenase [Rhizobium acaciae]MCW1750085.1 shikimate dehydrogenase [Rhizobium acaciae]